MPQSESPTATTALVLDNSKRSTYRSCKKKYKLQILLGLQPNSGSTALRFGSCWHAIQEGYHQYVIQNGWPRTQDQHMLAITQGLQMGKDEYAKESEDKTFYDDFKNFNTAAEGFSQYLDYFNTDKDFVEILSTEQKFECPMEPDNSTEEKLLSSLPPLTFTGRLDLALKMDGINWINDFKTTGWILDKVIAQANRSAQFIGYSYAAKKVLGFESQGCLGNFMSLNAYRRKGGDYGKVKFNFKRVPQIYSPGDIDAWKLSFLETANKIWHSMQEDLWPESFDNCFQYGECAYLKLCRQHVPDEDLNLSGYHVKFWDVLDD